MKGCIAIGCKEYPCASVYALVFKLHLPAAPVSPGTIRGGIAFVGMKAGKRIHLVIKRAPFVRTVSPCSKQGVLA